MGGEFRGERIHVCVWLSPFAVHLKLSQHRSSAILQYKVKNWKRYKYLSNEWLGQTLLIIPNSLLPCPPPGGGGTPRACLQPERGQSDQKGPCSRCRLRPTLLMSQPPLLPGVGPWILPAHSPVRSQLSPTLGLAFHHSSPASLHPDTLLSLFCAAWLLLQWKWKSLSCVRLLRPRGLYSPWNSPGQDIGVGSHSLHQGIFWTQGWNLGLLHCRQILYHLSHQGMWALTITK